MIAAVAYAPYITLLVCTIAAWLLRSGSMAASSAGRRRQLRGVKWYDAPQLLLAAPWHLVKSIPGTLLLLVWSLGIATAFALICFAAALSGTTSLAVIGVGFALAMWWGPGGERVRSSLHRVVDPAGSARGPWLLVTLLVCAGAAGLGRPLREPAPAGRRMIRHRSPTYGFPAGCELVRRMDRAPGLRTWVTRVDTTHDRLGEQVRCPCR